MTKDDIQSYLHQFQIHDLQLDLNGVCNAKCWFCPVAYETAPKHSNMSIENVKKILDNIVSQRGKLISENFKHIYTAHYNEILLYPHYEEFLQLLKERDLTTMVLTNGVTLTPAKIDLLKRNQDVISGICLNIPAIEKEEWIKQVGLSAKLHDRLLNNINYLHEVFEDRIANSNVSVVMNGISENSFFEKGGWIEKGTSMKVANSCLEDQYEKFKLAYPKLHIYKNPSIVDRDKLLEKNNIISLSKATDKYNKTGRRFIGCRNGSESFKEGEMTGRPFGWLHVNSLGNAFLCCQDFHMKSTFGNLIENDLETVWYSDEHIELIQNSFMGACATCNYAQWSD